MKPNWIAPILILSLSIPAQSIAKKHYKDLEKAIPYEKIETLNVDVEIGIAELVIGKVEGDNLFEAKIHYLEQRGEPSISFDRAGKVGYLTIKSAECCDEGENLDLKGIDTGDERWVLLFSPKVRSSFDIEVGLVDGRVDMTGLKVTDLTLSCGLSNLELSFDEPNGEVLKQISLECGLGDLKGRNLGNANFQRLKLESGLGSIKLDLLGEWRQPEAEITVEVGLGSARLEVPEAIGVEVNAGDNFLSSIDLARDILIVRKGHHRSDNWDSAVHRIVIDADVGLGSLKVRRID